MAKYLLAAAVRDHRGTPMKESQPNGEPLPLTLGFVLERACIMGGEPDAKQDAKYKQYKLAQRIGAGMEPTSDPVEFSAEEIVTLKKLCSHFPTIIYGAVYDMLENQQWRLAVDPLPADIAAVIGNPGGSE